ncbi:MAG: DUF6503 family protein [Bacteroidota bacterium]
MSRILFLPLLILFAACARPTTQSEPAIPPQEALSPAQQLVNEAIEAHGGATYEAFALEFQFRDKRYRGTRNGGKFQYERLFEQGEDAVRDVLTNDSFERYLNGTLVDVPDTMAAKYANSVNSVWYFALLPYGLNDGAVNKQLLGRSEIKGINYHKLQVDFEEEGGGKDFDDVFVYWIHPETKRVDYLAYEYHTDGGGIRFREAYHSRMVEGILLQDYVNYKAKPEKVELLDIETAFQAGELQELSRIELIE